MKHLLVSILAVVLFSYSVVAQVVDLLPGVWYAKLRAYPFRQDGTATVFVKNVIKNHKQRLIIDKGLNYVYTEYTGTDSILATGAVSVQGDTITFTQHSSGKTPPRLNQVSRFFLYKVDNGQLVYSSSTLANKKEEEKGIFEPVETKALFKKGQHQLLKEIYYYLTPATAESVDSVYLNSYNFVVDEEGTADLSTLADLSGRRWYLAVINEVIGTFSTSFLPARQNGRPVRSRMTIKFTY